MDYSPVSPHYEPYSAGMHEGRWQARGQFGYKARSRPAGERPTGWVYGELGTEVSSHRLLPQGDRSLTLYQRTTGELGTGAAEKTHSHSAQGVVPDTPVTKCEALQLDSNPNPSRAWHNPFETDALAH